MKFVTITEAREALNDSWMFDYLECYEGDTAFFNYYAFPEFEDSKEGFSELIFISESLATYGFEIQDPYVDHDTICGDLIHKSNDSD